MACLLLALSAALAPEAAGAPAFAALRTTASPSAEPSPTRTATASPRPHPASPSPYSRAPVTRVPGERTTPAAPPPAASSPPSRRPRSSATARWPSVPSRWPSPSTRTPGTRTPGTRTPGPDGPVPGFSVSAPVSAGPATEGGRDRSTSGRPTPSVPPKLLEDEPFAGRPAGEGRVRPGRSLTPQELASAAAALEDDEAADSPSEPASVAPPFAFPSSEPVPAVRRQALGGPAAERLRLLSLGSGIALVGLGLALLGARMRRVN